MRTTLTIDDDVAHLLKAKAAERNLPWKEVVNEVLRRGLRAPEAEAAEPYRTPTSDPGPPALKGVHGVHEMLAFAEGEDYR